MPDYVPRLPPRTPAAIGDTVTLVLRALSVAGVSSPSFSYALLECVGHQTPASRLTLVLSQIAPRVVTPIGSTQPADEPRVAALWDALARIHRKIVPVASRESATIADLPQIRPLPPEDPVGFGTPWS